MSKIDLKWTRLGMLVSYGNGLRTGATNTGDEVRAESIVQAHNEIVDYLLDQLEQAKRAAAKPLRVTSKQDTPKSDLPRVYVEYEKNLWDLGPLRDLHCDEGGRFYDSGLHPPINIIVHIPKQFMNNEKFMDFITHRFHHNQPLTLHIDFAPGVVYEAEAHCQKFKPVIQFDPPRGWTELGLRVYKREPRTNIPVNMNILTATEYYP